MSDHRACTHRVGGSLRRRAAESGFTLIELMVALVLGLVLLVGVVGLFTSSRQSFRVNENMGRVQENGRLAFELMAREFREAGSNPCGARAVANVVRVNTATPWWADWEAGTVRGFDDAEDSTTMVGFGTTPGARVQGTDAALALRAVLDESAFQPVSAHDLAGTSFAVPNARNFGSADVITVCDTKSVAIAQVASVDTGATPNIIKYGSSALGCNDNLGYPTPVDCTDPPAKTFDAGAIVAKYEPVFWYVGVNPRGGRSLYRMKLTRTGSTPAAQTVAEEMVPSVQDMQIEYLRRDIAAGNVLDTTWVGASDASFGGAAGWSTTNDKQVVAMRITLTFHSEEAVGTDGKPLARQFIVVASLRARDI